MKPHVRYHAFLAFAATLCLQATPVPAQPKTPCDLAGKSGKAVTDELIRVGGGSNPDDVGLPFQCLSGPLKLLAMTDDDSVFESQCGGKDDYTHHGFMQNGGGFTDAATLTGLAKSVGVIRFNAGGALLGGAKAFPDNAGYCSGALIAKDLFLTASHCATGRFHSWGQEDEVYIRKNGKLQIAMPGDFPGNVHVTFGYELASDCGCAAGRDFPVTGIVEHPDPDASGTEPPADYAILRLGPGVDGKLPGETVGIAIAGLRIGAAANHESIAVIQHPEGRLQVVATGTVLKSEDGILQYSDVDTLGGSSGAPVFDLNGRIAGVHTNGGCDNPDFGSNRGYDINKIAKHSCKIRELSGGPSC